MAEIVASPLVEFVLKKISTPLLEGVWLFLGVNNDMKKLQSTLSTISSVLADAQRKSVRDEKVRDWLMELNSAALEARKVVNEFQIEKLQREASRQGMTLDAKVREFFSSDNPIVRRQIMSRKIKHVTKRLGDISKNGDKFHFEKNLLIDRETSSYVIESDVYGRGRDREEVVQFLVHTDNNKDVSILSIVGLGGIGKTTLAQLVYNDDRINAHFQLKAWVCVSEPFDVKTIIGNIIGHKCDSLEIMQQQLREKLTEKKFLVVLDDVWNENGAEWEKLEALFRGGEHGSKILVTTRSSEVARIMGTVAQPYKLQGLSYGDCWTLFSQRAFGLRGQVETQRLIEIGKEIVFTKCGGLPLAAKALGSLMGSIREEQEWLSVKNSEIWKLPPAYSNNINILHVLKLSYEYLPPYLKQCFLYCSLFPKDYEIDKEKLIQMWIAEGFIPLSLPSDEGGQFDAEDIGERYFNLLLWRSFFQDERKDEYGNVCCKMHDLVCDLACLVAGDESCIVEAGSGCERDVSAGCHYISMVYHGVVYEEIMIPKADYKSVKLRTFLAFLSGRIDKVKVQWRMMPTHLRVLDLSSTGIGELPDSLGILKHLRFLDLSWTEIRTIPDSIISLKKLQTLNLRHCRKLERLPQGIRFLSRLRHLDIRRCFQLTGMPRGIGQLTNLRTLTMFMVGLEERGATIMELQHLNLIRGDLQIRGLEHVKDGREAMQANLLAAKTGVQKLQLAWDISASSSSSSEEDVLESFRPHINLKELTIFGYAGTRFPSWMTTPTQLCCFPNLVMILLWNIKRCESLPPLGHLPLLQHLVVDGMPELVEWSTEQISTGRGMESIIYPCLEKIEIKRCPKLARFPWKWLFVLTALRQLDIHSCPLVGTHKWRKIGEKWRKEPSINFVTSFRIAQETKT